MSDQSDNEHEQIETPLLKKKSNNKKNEDIKNEDIKIEKIEKIKKPRSEKQIEQFKKVAERRTQKIEEHNYNKKIEASKLLMEDTIKKFV